MIPASIIAVFTGDEYPLWLYIGFVVICMILYALTGMAEWIISGFKRD